MEKRGTREGDDYLSPCSNPLFTQVFTHLLHLPHYLRIYLNTNLHTLKSRQINNFRSYFSTHLQPWRIFIYWVAVGVFNSLPPKQSAPRPQIWQMTHPHNHKTALSKIDQPNSWQKNPKSWLEGYVACSFSVHFTQYFCACYLWLRTKLSVLPEVGLCHHPSAPLLSLETPSDSDCSRRCGYGVWFLMWPGFSTLDPAPNLILYFCQNLWYWIITSFATGPDRTSLCGMFDFGWTDLLQPHFWIWSIFDFGSQQSNMERERQGEEEREGEESIIAM